EFRRVLFRSRKFVRRHRKPLGAAALLALSLLGGTVVAFTGWRRALRAEGVAEERRRQVQRARATLARVNQAQQQILSAPYSHTKGRDVRLADLLDAAVTELDRAGAGDAEVEVGLRNAVGIGYLGLGLLAEAEQQFRRGVERLRAHGLADSSP